MRILYLGYFDELCASLAAKYYLRKALKKHARVITYGPEGFRWGRGIDALKLEKIYKPDVIILQGRFVTFDWPKKHGKVPWKNLGKTSAPKALFFNELKTLLDRRIEEIKRDKIDMTLWGTHKIMSEKTNFFKGHKKRWLPWCVDTNIFKDYGFKRIYDVALLGALDPTYPLRSKAKSVLSNMKGINFLWRPRPSRAIRLGPNEAFIHERYAKDIARSKILLFDSYRGFAIKKYYEGMACKTLILATNPYLDAERLHFKDGVNFVAINESNYLQKIQYYLKNEKERIRITENAYKMVRKYHSAEVRAEQLYGYLKELVK